MKTTETGHNLKSSIRRLAMVASVVGTIGLIGCGEDAIQGAPPKAPGQKAGPAQKVEPASELAKPSAASTEEYVRPEYPETQRRNPFQPDPEVVQPQKNVAEGELRTREPLEQFGLGQLDLVAIISEVAVPKAMFVDPDGFGHVVKEGDRIGRNSGVISDIRDNAVEVTEGSDEEDSQTLQRVIKLRDAELSLDREGLTDEERQALERLLESDAGREALKRQYETNAPGATAAESGGAQAPPQRAADPRFRGLAPPTKN